MIASRSISDLLPQVAAKAYQLLHLSEEAGIPLIVTSTYRDFDSQGRLYAQGRNLPGKIITRAKPGMSWHNWRRAFDIVPIINGKARWGTLGTDREHWLKVGAMGESIGLEWGGNWESIKDMPHFQLTEGLTLASLLKTYPNGLPST